MEQPEFHFGYISRTGKDQENLKTFLNPNRTGPLENKTKNQICNQPEEKKTNEANVRM